MAGMSGLGLTACASVTPEMAARDQSSRQAVAPMTPGAGGGEGPRAQAGGRYKLGAPYQAGGLWYVPAEQPSYDEVGVASWYGDDFNGQATANGERFDMYGISAAHATLPMPSIVEVTNLENGRTIRVRLNDRGPFKNGRIIDLSRGAAQQLGYMDKGTAKVRVRYVGPARLDGSLDPLFVADKGPSRPLQQLAALAAAPPPAAVQAVWRHEAPGPTLAPAAQPMPSPARYPAAPTPAQSFVAADGFSVQAGAFADPAKAQRIASALASAGAAAVRPLETADRRLYRVVLGPWREASQAQAARAQVAALGYADARVVRAF